MARAEIEHLREYISTLELRLQDAHVDRDEWKAKAKSLAGNFLNTLKGLKTNLYSVKRD